MAQQGEMILKIQSLLALYEQAGTYQAAVEDALYAHYKNAFKISQSIHFRGEAADAFKEYIKNGTINVLTGLMDIAAETTMMCQLLAEGFYGFEHNDQGVIAETVMDGIAGELASRERDFDSIKSEIREAGRLSSQYISVQNVNTDAVNAQYERTNRALEKIRTDLYAVDEEARKYVEELYSRITALKELLHKTMGTCYKDGVINPNELQRLKTQSWYYQETNLTLYTKLQEDPFVYAAGETTLMEDQWAAGLCSDVYAYAGYSVLDRSYEAGVEDGTAFGKAKFSVLEANGYAQLTEYLTGQANLKAGYADVDVKAGLSRKYMGFKAEADVGLVKVDGSVVLGNENANGFIKGDAKALCADGKAAFEFKDNGEFAVGVDASATAASASIKGGVSLFSYTNKSKDKLTGKKKDESLLSFQVGAKVNAGGSFAAYTERKNVVETEYFNIQTTRLKLDISLGIGVDLDVTVPTISLNWKWLW